MPSEMPYCGGHPEYKGVGCPLCVVARERVAGMKADASRLAAVEAERDAAVARAERFRIAGLALVGHLRNAAGDLGARASAYEDRFSDGVGMGAAKGRTGRNRSSANAPNPAAESDAEGA